MNGMPNLGTVGTDYRSSEIMPGDGDRSILIDITASASLTAKTSLSVF